MSEPKETPPLWLPKGSVRSIIALAFVVASIYALVSETKPEFAAPIYAFTGAVVQHYFEMRKQEKPM